MTPSRERFSLARKNSRHYLVSPLRRAAIASYRTNAEVGDNRVNRFTTATPLSAFGGASLIETNIFLTDPDPIPLFSQDELALIRAEAYARTIPYPFAQRATNPNTPPNPT